MVDASERLQVLLVQEEAIYKTSDYLARLQAPTTMLDVNSSSPKKRKSWDDGDNGDCAEQSSTAGSADEDVRPPNAAGSEGSSSTQINKHWREKICEWAYQGTFYSHTLSFPIYKPFLYTVSTLLIGINSGRSL